MQRASTAFIEALHDAGVSYIFANLGSDHAAIIEALAEARATLRPSPRLITCPNEMVALSAAHGFAQVTGRAQAVIVHVECGTQALAGALHNAARARIPALIFAGASPFTQEGELSGSRNEFIHWIQDVFDQRGIVRGYVKYENEIRTGRNIRQLVFRALQFAHSDPRGPVYLVGAREVMEEEVPEVEVDAARWRPIAPMAIAPSEVAAIVEHLLAARRPLIVTSHLGRNPAAFAELTRLCRRLGIGLLESAPSCVNFPADDPLYQGSQWNEPHQNAALEGADFVLVIDSDVPWIPLHNRPQEQAVIYHIDVDPLKERMPLWQIPAARVFRADAATALAQINERLRSVEIDEIAIGRRRAYYEALHKERLAQLVERERIRGDEITPAYLTARVRKHLDREMIVLNEGISNYQTIFDHLRAGRAGQVIASGGGSLGWSGGAAIGVKLAHPEKTVISLIGDGSYLFSVPSSVFWMARRYETPFLQIIYNNRGWRSPKLSTLAIHPEGYASRSDEFGVSFDPPPDYAGIAAAAGGAFAQTVRWVDELDEALERAIHAVRSERCAAVLDVWLPSL